jgi:hypothetical protein
MGIPERFRRLITTNLCSTPGRTPRVTAVKTAAGLRPFGQPLKQTVLLSEAAK